MRPAERGKKWTKWLDNEIKPQIRSIAVNTDGGRSVGFLSFIHHSWYRRTLYSNAQCRSSLLSCLLSLSTKTNTMHRLSQLAVPCSPTSKSSLFSANSIANMSLLKRLLNA